MYRAPPPPPEQNASFVDATGSSHFPEGRWLDPIDKYCHRQLGRRSVPILRVRDRIRPTVGGRALVPQSHVNPTRSQRGQGPGAHGAGPLPAMARHAKKKISDLFCVKKYQVFFLTSFKFRLASWLLLSRAKYPHNMTCPYIYTRYRATYQVQCNTNTHTDTREIGAPEQRRTQQRLSSRITQAPYERPAGPRDQVP